MNKAPNIDQHKKIHLSNRKSEELFKDGVNPDIEMRPEQALNVPATEMLMVTVDPAAPVAPAHQDKEKLPASGGKSSLFNQVNLSEKNFTSEERKRSVFQLFTEFEPSSLLHP